MVQAVVVVEHHADHKWTASRKASGKRNRKAEIVTAVEVPPVLKTQRATYRDPAEAADSEQESGDGYGHRSATYRDPRSN